MSEVEVEQDGKLAVQETGVTTLDPLSTRIYEEPHGLLHCAVKNSASPRDDCYDNVFAVRMFPVSHPTRFISVRHTTRADKVREIGVVADLDVFPPDQKRLVLANLRKQYHEQVISRIHSIRQEYGMLFFVVQTQRGREQFIMPWKGDRAEDLGDDGKVLIDALDNRYIIPEVSQLTPTDQRKFTTYVYW